MIDVIIPAYNAHNTIKNTLLSIGLQSIKNKLKVYIVNDNSQMDYKKEVELFRNIIDLKELKLKKNSGPGVARQYGIDNSNNPYIVFIDADDMFMNKFSLENLYNTIISENNDMAIGMMVEEIGGEYNYFENHEGCLHAKMYKREYINKYQFKFNKTRYSEDHAFNKLYLLSHPKIGLTDEKIYLYKNNKLEVDISKYIKGYIYNAIWTVKEAEKRKFYKCDIADVVYTAFYYVYFEYLSNSEKETEILKYIKPLKEYYLNYRKNIKNERKIEIFKAFEETFYGIPKISISQFLKKL